MTKGLSPFFKFTEFDDCREKYSCSIRRVTCCQLRSSFESNCVVSLPYGDFFRSPNDSIHIVMSKSLSMVAFIDASFVGHNFDFIMCLCIDWVLYHNRTRVERNAAFEKVVVALYLSCRKLHISGSSWLCITYGNGPLPSHCRIIEHATSLKCSASFFSADLSSLHAVFQSDIDELSVYTARNNYQARFSFSMHLAWTEQYGKISGVPKTVDLHLLFNRHHIDLAKTDFDWI